MALDIRLLLLVPVLTTLTGTLFSKYIAYYPWRNHRAMQKDRLICVLFVSTCTRSSGLVYTCTITKIRLFENFTTKNWKFSDKNSNIFHFSAQNNDCGYSLEPPRRGGSNKYHNLCFWAEIRKRNYTLVSQFYYIKLGFKGVKIIQACFRDAWAWICLLTWCCD